MARNRKSQSNKKPIKSRRRVPPKVSDETYTGCASSSHTRNMTRKERKMHKEIQKLINRKTSTSKCEAKRKPIGRAPRKVSGSGGTTSKKILPHNNDEGSKKQMKSGRKIVKHTRPKHKYEDKKKPIGGVLSPKVSRKNLSQTMNDERSMKHSKAFRPKPEKDDSSCIVT